MFACLIFSLVMVPAGRMQDKLGPRWVATLGGVLVGAGMIIAGFTTSAIGYIIGFGVLAGAGFGFGYASATPPAVKWFPAAKTGLIAGIVVSGFGLSPAYASPLTKTLIQNYGMQSTVLILGILFLVIVTVLSQLLKVPSAEYAAALKAATAPKNSGVSYKIDFSPKEMLRTPQFFLIWFMYACGSGAGLMIISKLAAIADIQMNIHLGFVLVAIMAIGNGGGRIITGMLSDKIGRKATLFLCFVLQAACIMLLSIIKADTFLATIPVMAILSALIGANYGANLALFPSLTKDFYGLKNFGVNYGLVFTAWGVGGFMLAFLAGKIYDIHKTFAISYYGASILLVLAAMVVFFVTPPRRSAEKE
jgi:OFA family oxalate/formate antiporter-like MFS transporter